MAGLPAKGPPAKGPPKDGRLCFSAPVRHSRLSSSRAPARSRLGCLGSHAVRALLGAPVLLAATVGPSVGLSVIRLDAVAEQRVRQLRGAIGLLPGELGTP